MLLAMQRIYYLNLFEFNQVLKYALFYFFRRIGFVFSHLGALFAPKSDRAKLLHLGCVYGLLFLLLLEKVFNRALI